MNPQTDDNESAALDHALHGDEARHLAYGQLADEIQEILKAGQQPDASSLQEKHPQLAAEIPQLIPALAILDEIGIEPTAPAGGADTADVVLGDFRIIREIGRGGMGVVYEAAQISLARKVAVKVLPYAALLDSRQLARFKNETLAAAALKHPNIVSVYSVGCERSIHFYAMELVDGQSLANVLHPIDLDPTTDPTADPAEDTNPVAALSTQRESKSPEFFEAVARLGIQAAEALQHAHQMGVVHRDIKPSNLLVDSSGDLWVTDFGLAQIETEASLTVTGDILGTLRYMSPEQAADNRDILDHRTDIYSLGITFSELLTGQHVFAGDDRRKLLRDLVDREPRPPRSVDPQISIDLDTIVVKATAKEPTARYATMQELADELHRFLAGEPILARRVGPTTRAAKWCRRNRLLTSLVTILVLMACTMVFAVARWTFFAQVIPADTALTLRPVCVPTGKQVRNVASNSEL